MLLRPPPFVSKGTRPCSNHAGLPYVKVSCSKALCALFTGTVQLGHVWKWKQETSNLKSKRTSWIAMVLLGRQTDQFSEWGAAADTQGMRWVKRLISGIMTAMRCSTSCLPLAAQGSSKLKGTCDGRPRGGNPWRSTKLISWKIGPLSKSSGGQVRGGGGMHCTLFSEGVFPSEAQRDGTATGPPLDHLWIKELAHSDFTPSWKLSKGPPVMPLILSPSSHIWRYHEGVWQPVDCTAAPDPCLLWAVWAG